MNATDDQIIAAYIARRNKIDELTKQANAALEVATGGFAADMKVLAAEMQRRLLERNGGKPHGHSTTDAGVAFLEESMSVKCTDKDALLQWSFQNYEKWGQDLLTANVAKETLRSFIDATKTEVNPDGELPPGLTVSYAVNVKFRKG